MAQQLSPVLQLRVSSVTRSSLTEGLGKGLLVTLKGHFTWLQTRGSRISLAGSRRQPALSCIINAAEFVVFKKIFPIS